jgi:hypothetical protein
MAQGATASRACLSAWASAAGDEAPAATSGCRPRRQAGRRRRLPVRATAAQSTWSPLRRPSRHRFRRAAYLAGAVSAGWGLGSCAVLLPIRTCIVPCSTLSQLCFEAVAMSGEALSQAVSGAGGRAGSAGHAASAEPLPLSSRGTVDRSAVLWCCAMCCMPASPSVCGSPSSRRRRRQVGDARQQVPTHCRVRCCPHLRCSTALL